MTRSKTWKCFIVLLLIFSGAPSYSYAGDISLPKNKRLVIIASRPTYEEAVELAENYKPRFTGTQVMVATNGWYSISIGSFYKDEKYLLDQLIADGEIPSDSYLSKTTRFSSINNESKTRYKPSNSDSGTGITLFDVVSLFVPELNVFRVFKAARIVQKVY